MASLEIQDNSDAVFLPPQEIQFTFDDIDTSSATDLRTRGSFTQAFASNMDGNVPRSASSTPITIPGSGVRPPSQRHTNFTPPRSYMALNPATAKMVRSASASSLPTAVSVLLSEHIHPGSLTGCLSSGRRQQSTARRFTIEQTSNSAPNFERCALEQDIGLELRAISDSFHLECGGFRDGYDFARSSSRAYSSSYPGSIRVVGQSAGWQEVVTALSPSQCRTFSAFSRPDASRS